MKQEENGRQLKLDGQDQDGLAAKKKKKARKKNKTRDRWVVFMVLFITILVSLGFYVVSGGKRQGDESPASPTKPVKLEETEKGGGFFGEAVYEF